MRKIFWIVLMLLPLSACNTVQGIGQDFKEAGQALKETADNVRHKIAR